MNSDPHSHSELPIPAPSPKQKEPTTKELLQGCVVLLVVAFIVKSCFFEDGSKPDLKNPPVALENLARKALDSEAGIESIKVETIRPDNSSYAVRIRYHAKFILNEESTFKSIRFAMERTYRDVLKYPELPVAYIEIAAQLELQDKFGNQRSFSDVYLTQLPSATIQRLNRQRLDSVKFNEIWDEVFTHPMFQTVKNRDY